MAAKGGHFEVLKWACANGCPWDKTVCANLAREGHFEVLKWAHANGCLWNKSTTYVAATEGHCKMLQWAHANVGGKEKGKDVDRKDTGA